MKYMVMECHLSYAVVLDEDGRFLHVANKHYEVGQMVTDVIEMQTSQPESSSKSKKHYRWIGSLVAMAACLALVVTSFFQFDTTLYGSVYLTINPEVRIDVNKDDIVIDVEGINEDGKTLVEDYKYRKKDLELVMDELVDRAIDMGYLHEGGQITLTLDADSDEWVVTKSDSLNVHLNEHLTDKMSVTIEVTNTKSENQGVTIPVTPESGTPDNVYGESDYGEATPTPSTNPTTPSENNQSNNDDTDYGPNNDGVTDYTDSQDSNQSNYSDDNAYGDDNSGDSNYGENGDSNYDSDDNDD